MRKILITAGMTQEFEVIETNAPDEIIEEQLRLNMERAVSEDPYDVIEGNGYIIESLGCQDDFEIEEVVYDKEFDYYDY